MNKKIIKIISITLIILLIIYFLTGKKIELFTNNKIKISVLILLKNNEFYTKKLDYLFKEFENDPKYEFTYFIYENNSKDETKEEIVKFLKNRKGRVILENIDKPKNFGSIISKVRGEFMSELRNSFKYLHGNLKSDYTLLIDSDVIFCKSAFEKMISKINNENVMITPFSFDGDVFMKDNSCLHYYDTLALISKDNISHVESKNTCLNPLCKHCIDYRKKKNINLEDKFLLYDKIVEVKSAFAGFCLIDTKIYNKINWEGTICEHHSFCEKVREFGKILLLNDVYISTISNLKTEKTFKFIFNTVNKLN